MKWAVTGLMFLLAFKINKTKFHSEKENKSGENKFTNRQKPSFYLTIGSLFARIIGRWKVHKNHEKVNKTSTI